MAAPLSICTKKVSHLEQIKSESPPSLVQIDNGTVVFNSLQPSDFEGRRVTCCHSELNTSALAKDWEEKSENSFYYWTSLA
ncbi:hypothetical protein TNCV_3021341 [Trichonephila clavipes]|nr:hypothetical protein TNCV_3021341 [Trichonephila clavipes]